MGKSHGGFISAWLANKGVYNSVVLINPVIDLNLFYKSSDIPDWVSSFAFCVFQIFMHK